MIWFDVTKTGPSGHRSGLSRVSLRLREELGPAARPVAWGDWNRGALAGDWFFTAELFSEVERPGWWDFLRRPPCRLAAVFHDAIPLRHPHITWPQSVSRHPEYMKMLASFDRVFAVSAASRDELLGFWRWQGVSPRGGVEVLPLGADFNGARRVEGPASADAARLLLTVGILEPRKNQLFLLERCAELWAEGLEFELHLVGRVNPHFGGPVLARIKALQHEHAGLVYHAAASDAVVAGLYARARASVFPTLAEGCGLPLLESLWAGVPCLCTDLPVLRENADGGGCLTAPPNDAGAWRDLLRRALTDDALVAELAAAARTRPLPRWSAAAAMIRERLV
jgi:glycosyltransferase involved in cell wall biosynthesis